RVRGRSELALTHSGERDPVFRKRNWDRGRGARRPTRRLLEHETEPRRRADEPSPIEKQSRAPAKSGARPHIASLMWTFQRSTHPREPHLLPLVERLVEVRERGADRGGGGAHGGEALAHRVHAADRGERALGGAGAAERVGGLERGGDELVEGDALRRAQTHV